MGTQTKTKENYIAQDFKIELKKFSHSASLSEETNAFTADLYIDGKMVGYCRNDGRGGSTSIMGKSPEHSAIINKADAFFSSQPEIYDAQFDFSYKNSLESVVDNLVGDMLVDKLLASEMKKGILYGKEKSNPFVYSWKMNGKRALIADILKSAKGMDTIKTTIAKLKADGHNIFNTNLPAELFAA